MGCAGNRARQHGRLPSLTLSGRKDEFSIVTDSVSLSHIMSNSSHTMFLMDLDDVGASDPFICTLQFKCLSPTVVPRWKHRFSSEVKQHRARLVLGWVTAWNTGCCCILFLTFFFFFSSMMRIYQKKKKKKKRERERDKKKAHILDSSVSLSTGAVSVQLFFFFFTRLLIRASRYKYKQQW